MKLLCVLASLIAVGVAVDNKCCLPEQMSALEGMMMGQVTGGEPHVILGNIGLSMDQSLLKTNSYISLSIGEKQVNERVIQDFNQGQKMQYLILNGVCTKSVLEDWKPPCLENESYLFDTYVGAFPSTLPARVYNVEEGDITAYVVTTMEKECVPITEAAFGTQSGTSFAMTITFMNATRSVLDPSVFNVPSICNNAPLVPKKHTMSGSLLFH